LLEDGLQKDEAIFGTFIARFIEEHCFKPPTIGDWAIAFHKGLRP
jgi:hypothetical protein